MKLNEIILRDASITDLDILQHWDEQEHVIASDPNDDWNWTEELSRRPAWRQMLIAEVEGKSIGFVQIIDAAQEETHYWGNVPAGTKAIDIWIGEKENLNKGYGTEMMQMALELCFKDEATHIVLIDPLESNKDAIRFYERLGFSFVEQRTFGDDECLVYQMTRANWRKQT